MIVTVVLRSGAGVGRDANGCVGFGDAVVNRAALTVVVRVGITAVKAPRIAVVGPCIGMLGAIEIQQATEILDRKSVV